MRELRFELMVAAIIVSSFFGFVVVAILSANP